MKAAPVVLVVAILTGGWITSGWCENSTSGRGNDVFAFNGADNLLDEEHFGITNGRMAPGINYKTLASLHGLWAPPLVSSDFVFDLQIGDQPVPTRDYTWHPFEVERSGSVQGVSVTTTTTLLYGYPALILAVTLENRLEKEITLPLTTTVSGTLDKEGFWEFSRPASKTPARSVTEGSIHELVQGSLAIVIRSDLDPFKWEDQGKNTLYLAPAQKRVIHFCIAVGDREEARQKVTLFMQNPRQSVMDSWGEYSRRVADLFDHLPRFHADHRELEQIYNRSLVHLLMNRWDVPEFVLKPYYSTGSVKGGCVCNYLWNFGEVWEILPLYDPSAAREHIKQFLKGDITSHFAFNPIDGVAWGPWYPVNQEKIIGSIYYYVTLTGDAAFLNEEVAGKTILDWVVFHSTVGDDLSRPVALVDYGPGNHHLELRRGFPYNHVMPDLNGRRVTNYWMADALVHLAGKDFPDTRERQEQLRQLLVSQLWDPQRQWFAFTDDKGNHDFRYTMQMFKLIGSHAIPHDQEIGLVSHLNETEFLSEYGFHSLSKTDIAYDQVDIDNGGGGACTSFPPQIIERLYRAGFPEKAEDILQRILWWGQKLPYWGDSIVANHQDYRRDTPLQCTLDGSAVAQCVLFGLCGIGSDFDGNLVIHPNRLSFSKRYELTGIKVLGTSFDIQVDENHFLINHHGQTLQAELGKEVTLSKDDLKCSIR